MPGRNEPSERLAGYLAGCSTILGRSLAGNKCQDSARQTGGGSRQWASAESTWSLLPGRSELLAACSAILMPRVSAAVCWLPAWSATLRLRRRLPLRSPVSPSTSAILLLRSAMSVRYLRYACQLASRCSQRGVSENAGKPQPSGPPLRLRQHWRLGAPRRAAAPNRFHEGGCRCVDPGRRWQRASMPTIPYSPADARCAQGRRARNSRQRTLPVEAAAQRDQAARGGPDGGAGTVPHVRAELGAIPSLVACPGPVDAT